MFKEAADRLGGLEKDRSQLLPRNVSEEWKESGEEAHLVEMTLFGLLSAFKDVLIHAQQDLSTELLRPRSRHPKDQRPDGHAPEQREVEFQGLLNSLHSKLERIVTFLALLELVRLKLVRAFQRGAFGEIRLYLAGNAPELDPFAKVRKPRKKAAAPVSEPAPPEPIDGAQGDAPGRAATPRQRMCRRRKKVEPPRTPRSQE